MPDLRVLAVQGLAVLCWRDLLDSFQRYSASMAEAASREDWQRVRTDTHLALGIGALLQSIGVQPLPPGATLAN